MLKSIMGSETRVKILALFFLNPDRKFYVREIARRTGENINSVRRELQKLESIDLLRNEREGNLKYYAANKKMPIYEELKRIFLKTEGLGEIMKENLSKLGGVKFAFVYGSFAKGEERLKSDIDIMIVGEVDEKKLIPLIRKLEVQLSREINYTLLTTVEFELRMRKGDPFITDVLRERKIMLVGEPSEVR